jgi:hypothetical protein
MQEKYGTENCVEACGGHWRGDLLRIGSQMDRYSTVPTEEEASIGVKMK